MSVADYKACIHANTGREATNILSRWPAITKCMQACNTVHLSVTRHRSKVWMNHSAMQRQSQHPAACAQATAGIPDMHSCCSVSDASIPTTKHGQLGAVLNAALFGDHRNQTGAQPTQPTHCRTKTQKCFNTNKQAAVVSTTPLACGRGQMFGPLTVVKLVVDRGQTRRRLR